MKVLIIALATLAASSLSLGLSAESVPTFELTVPPLSPEQPLLKTIRSWDKQIVVEAERYDRTINRWVSWYYVLDLDSERVRPLIIDACEVIHSIAESSQKAYAFCKNQQLYTLLSRTKEGGSVWQSDGVPKSLNTQDDHILVASENNLALVSSNYVYWRGNDGTWMTMPFHPPVSSTVKGPPRHALLDNYALFLGYNRGEWGGGLVRVPLTPNPDQPFRPPTLLSPMNVHGIAMDRTGAVWAAGGLAHLFAQSANLVVFKEEELQTVLNELSWFLDKTETEYLQPTPELRLPGGSDVSAMCLDQTGRPLVLATNLGIFEVGDQLIKYRVKGNFSIVYKMPGVTVGSSPVGMVATPDGSLLVATRSTGVLLFVNKANGYHLRQLTLPHSSSDQKQSR